MASDWTRDTTLSPPIRVRIKYSPLSSPSTWQYETFTGSPKTISTTTYQTFEYKDSEGQQQQEDAEVMQESITTTFIAAVSQNYVAAALSVGMNPAIGDAVSRQIKVSEYITTSEGLKIQKEREESWISEYELAGGLDIDFGGLSAVPGSLSWQPTGEEVLSSVTETIHEEYVVPGPYAGSPGKPYTRTKLSRWSCRGQTQEGKQKFSEDMKSAGEIFTGPALASVLGGLVATMKELVFLGTEIRTSIGRTPVPSRPTGQELDAVQIEDAAGPKPLKTFDAVNDYGSPDYASWSDYAQPGYGVADGSQDWAALVPTWQFYASTGEPDDSDQGWSMSSITSGEPLWVKFVPEGESWQDYDVDSDEDGIPDWAELIPPPEFYDGDSNGDGIPDWAEFVPDGSSRARTYVTETYEMPYGPDAFVAYDAEELSFIPSNAGEAMREFGETENTLRTGHALGVNVTSEAKALPTKPLAPIYLNAEGLVAGFLMNGVSWAFDANGLVVSADLLLMGVAGLDPAVEEAQAWVRLPGGTGGLQNLDLDPDLGGLLPANTITMPEGLPEADRYRVFRWLPRNGEDVLGPALQPDRALLAPFTPRSQMIGRSRHRAQLEEHPYRLSTTEELVGAVRVKATLEPVIRVPLVAVGIAAYAPGVSGSGAVVSVPAASLALAGLELQLAGMPRTIVAAPSTVIELAAGGPAVSGGAAVESPAAVIAITGAAPTGPSAPVIDSSTLLYLSLDGSLADASASARAVTITAGSGGVASGALNLPGDTYARVVPGISLPGDYTIECWFYASSQQDMALFGSTTDNHQILRFNYYANRIISYSIPGFYTDTNYSGFVTTNAWNHIAEVRSGSYAKVFLNGSLASSQAVTPFELLLNTIGAGYAGSNNIWNGMVDNVHISSVARYSNAFTPPSRS